MTQHNATEAIGNWHAIEWQAVRRIVKNLQIRIVKAVQVGKWKRVRDLQRLLTNSTAAKMLAVRRVTENRGKRTAGIDGVKWKTPHQKFRAINQLTNRGYHARAVRRIKIPKTNGKWRPLGIPTMHDRAMQALHLLTLEPISETLADAHSYGFRPYRSCADALVQCHRVLCRKTSARWILEADIKGCFDNISHDWLMTHIPMDKRILRQWLAAGYLVKQQLFPSTAGTPQGSVISPTLANLVLDGLQTMLDKTFGTRRTAEHGTYYNPHKIHFIRYADDFIITANSKSILQKQVRPLLEKFLAERGLQLSADKTLLTHIDDGFDFLGKNIRKYRGKLIIKPSKANVQTFLHKVKQTIRQHRVVKTERLIYRLNEMLVGWAMYHRTDNAKRTFAKVEHLVWRMTWRWAVRRHPNKGKRWIKDKYYRRHQGRDWTLFDYDENNNLVTLFAISKVRIQYHRGIKSTANPFDPQYELYFEKRHDLRMLTQLKGKYKVSRLYKRQQGKCPVCGQKISLESGWHTHHVVPRYLGGASTLNNLVLLHPVCHVQLHHFPNSVTAAQLQASLG